MAKNLNPISFCSAASELNILDKNIRIKKNISIHCVFYNQNTYFLLLVFELLIVTAAKCS